MKRKFYVSFSLILSASFSVIAQPKSSPLDVECYKLDNGLTVYLNQDETANSVMGQIVVKGGSKRDPKDATGIAHYFEHIMFKGSEKLGTVDFEKEKVYLDSIALEYDRLGSTTNKDERNAIQMKINALSVKAGEYAIPNEFDKIMNEIGGTGVNAYTSNEEIVYLNSFPACELERWLKVYADRFEAPVFRLFQSELETVYEEKNMSADYMETPIFERLMKEMFPGTPYGEQTVLGKAEHLKNPSLSKMQTYYDTYYVASNMALILTGDFDKGKAKPLVERYLGAWKKKPQPEHKRFDVKSYEGKHRVNARLAPIRLGTIAFHTIPKNHEDELALEVCTNLLSNYSYTGMLDVLTNDSKMLSAECWHQMFDDMGALSILYVPKLIGQSIGKAEKLILAEIEKVKKGDFSDDFLSGVKTELIKSHEEFMEDSQWRGYMLSNLFLYNTTWKDELNYAEKMQAITKEDVMKVANRYLGENYLSLHSRTGFSKKDKVEKPNFETIEYKNSEAQSALMKEVKEMSVKEEEPCFLTEGKDFTKGTLFNHIDYVYTKNKINSIFSLDIVFHEGMLQNSKNELAADILNEVGTASMEKEALLKKMQKLGADYYFNAKDNNIQLHVSGLEKNTEEIIALINDLISNPLLREKEKTKLMKQMKMSEKLERKETETKSQALYEFGLLGEKSYFLTKTSASELKKYSLDELNELAKNTLSKGVNIDISSSLTEDKFCSLIQTNLTSIKSNKGKRLTDSRHTQNIAANTIYFLNDKKAVQSKINIIIPGKTLTKNDVLTQKAFNEYFCAGMNSLVFQEIREFRSLAYSTWGRHIFPLSSKEKGYYRGGMSTQADKTVDALKAYSELLSNMPEKTERIENVKNGLIKSNNSKRASFRYIGNTVAAWQDRGYVSDPNQVLYGQYKTITMDMIKKFYAENIKDRPIVTTIVGDKRRIDMEELEKFGKIVEVKLSDVMY